MSPHRLFAIILLLAAAACAVYNYTDLFKEENKQPTSQKKQYRNKMPEPIDQYQGHFDSIYDTDIGEPGCGEDWGVWDDEFSGFSEDLRY